jgi:hypothetical protein
VVDSDEEKYRVLPGRSCGICHSNKTVVREIDHEGEEPQRGDRAVDGRRLRTFLALVYLKTT